MVLSKFEIAQYDNFDYHYCLVVKAYGDLQLTYSNSFKVIEKVYRRSVEFSKYDVIYLLDICNLEVLFYSLWK